VASAATSSAPAIKPGTRQ
jgi:hypothetical protein